MKEHVWVSLLEQKKLLCVETIYPLPMILDTSTILKSLATRLCRVDKKRMTQRFIVIAHCIIKGDRYIRCLAIIVTKSWFTLLRTVSRMTTNE